MIVGMKELKLSISIDVINEWEEVIFVRILDRPVYYKLIFLVSALDCKGIQRREAMIHQFFLKYFVSLCSHQKLLA